MALKRIEIDQSAEDVAEIHAWTCLRLVRSATRRRCTLLMGGTFQEFLWLLVLCYHPCHTSLNHVLFDKHNFNSSNSRSGGLLGLDTAGKAVEFDNVDSDTAGLQTIPFHFDKGENAWVLGGNFLSGL